MLNETKELCNNFSGAAPILKKAYKLSGYFTLTDGTQVAIKEIIYNNPATIVFWDDNTKTIAKCYENDNYNPETGLAICILKKLVGSTVLREVFQDWLPIDNSRVTLKDIRAKHNKKITNGLTMTASSEAIQTAVEDLSFINFKKIQK